MDAKIAYLETLDRSRGDWTHPKLICDPLFLRYDYLKRRGYLDLPEASCTDMTGCIHVFETIDAEVKEIAVYEGDRLDIVYIRKPGKWTALHGDSMSLQSKQKYAR